MVFASRLDVVHSEHLRFR